MPIINISEPLDKSQYWGEEEKLDTARAQKTLAQKTKAWFSNYASESTIANAITAVKDTGADAYQKEDKNFIGSLQNQESAFNIIGSMGGNNLDAGTISEIAGRAKNKFHLQRLVAEENLKVKDKQRVNETLGTIGQVSSTIIGRSDLDIATGTFGASLAKMGIATKNMVKIIGATETVSAGIKSQVYDDYYFKDAMLDITVNTASIIPIANMFRGDTHIDNVKTGLDNIPSKNEMNTMSRYIFPEIRNWSAQAENNVAKNIENAVVGSERISGNMEWMKDIQRKNQLEKAIKLEADIKAQDRAKAAAAREDARNLDAKMVDQTMYDNFQDATIDTAMEKQAVKTKLEQELEDLNYRISETKSNMVKQEEARLMEAERNKQLLYYNNVFSSEKYSKANMNRSEFLKAQDKLARDIKIEKVTKAIDDIKLEVKTNKNTFNTLSKQIDNAEANAKTITDVKVQAREYKKIEEMYKKLEESKKAVEASNAKLKTSIDSNSKNTLMQRLANAMESEKNNKQSYYKDVFGSSKYDTYKLNRSEFFKNQEATIKQIKNQQIDDKIMAANTEIKTHKSTIKELKSVVKSMEAKIGSYTSKAVISRETNKLNKIKDQLKNAYTMLSDAKKGLSIPIDTRVIDSIRRGNRSVMDMADDIAVALHSNIDRLKTEINDLKNAPDYVKKQYIEEYSHLMDELATSYPEEMQKVKSLFGSIGKQSKPFDITKLNNLSKKQKGALLALGLFGGTNAMASEGDDEFTFGLGSLVMTLAALYVLAPYTLKAFSHISNNGLKNSIRETMDKITESQNVSDLMRSAKGLEFGEMYDTVHRMVDTRFNSTLAEVRGWNIPEVTKIFEDLLFDPLNGAARTADIEIRQGKNSYKASVNLVKNVEYKNWLDEKAIGVVDKVMDQVELLKMFNKEIYDHISGINISKSPAVINTSKVVSKMFEDIKDAMIGSNIYGHEILNKSTNNYITRLWNFEDLSKIISKANPEELDALANNFSKLFVSQENAVTKAKQMIAWIGQSKNISNRDATDIIERLEQFFAEGTDLNQAKEALRTSKDVASRLKSRIDMDFTKWEDITIGGEKITLDTVIDRDVDDIMEKYLNQSLGMISFARRGYTSIYELEKTIAQATVGNNKAQKQAQTIIDLTLGKKVDMGDPNVMAVAQLVKELTFFVKLPSVFFSQLTEIGKSIQYAGLPMAMKNMRSLIKDIPEDSELMKSILESTGLGTHQLNQRLDIKGLDTTDLQMDRSLSSLGKVSLQLQEATAKYSGLLKGTDFAQRLTALKFSTDFASLVKGLPNDIPKSRYGVYGINDDVIKQFKDDFEFDNEGILKSIDRSGWSYEKQTLFQDIAFKVNQDYVPEVLLSTVGLWSKSSSLGQMLSFLTSYGTNLFTNQGRRDAHLRDGRAMWNAAQTFAYTYLGLSLKSEIEGKDYDDDQLVQYSMMNLPSFGLVGSLSSLTSPVVFSTADEVKKTVANEIYGLTVGDSNE